MGQNALLLSSIFVPIIGSFLTFLAGRVSPKLRNGLALACVMISLCSSLALAPQALAGKVATFGIRFPVGFDLTFMADGLAVFMAITSSLLGSIIVIYSFDYIEHYPNKNEYYMMVVLFLGSMMGLIYSANLLVLYIFWEITAIASWRLIGFFREKDHVLKADKAFLITASGAAFMLIGFILIYQQTATFDLEAIKKFFGANPVSDLIVALILLGILAKSATLPFQTWLPDAGIAPSPVTALLHAAVLVKIGVYVFARLFIATFTIGQIWHVIVPAIAAASAIISGGAALVENDMKRIIAYSTISQISFIFLGFAVASPIGIAGALLYILMHGIGKGGLFLCAGIVEQNTGTKDITRMGGLIKTMPVTAISFLLCSFSIMGIPPFGGFFSKYLVFAGTIDAGKITLAFIFMFGTVLTILYLFRIFNKIFMGEQGSGAKEGSITMVASVAVLAAISLVSGLYINGSSDFVRQAVKQMLGAL